VLQHKTRPLSGPGFYYVILIVLNVYTGYDERFHTNDHIPEGIRAATILDRPG